MREVAAVDSFSGKLAVVTGSGSGMGRDLVRQLAAAGCSVAACDWHADAVARTADMARVGASNADIGGGPSFVNSSRQEWERARLLTTRPLAP
jgi:NAD(P)-dependent dehydrogenase (short-subunit alcohol dehydrogenase family)